MRFKSRQDESDSVEHKISSIKRIRDRGRQEAKDRWMDGPAVTKRVDVPVPNEINRDPPVSRTPLRLSEIQRLSDGQSSRRSQPAWATIDRDRSHGASSLEYRFALYVRVQEYSVYHESTSHPRTGIYRVMR